MGQGPLGAVLEPVVQGGSTPRGLGQHLRDAAVQQDAVGERVSHHVALRVGASRRVVVQESVHAFPVVPGLAVYDEGDDLVVPHAIVFPGLWVVVGLFLSGGGGGGGCGGGGLLLGRGELLVSGKGLLGLDVDRQGHSSQDQEGMDGRLRACQEKGPMLVFRCGSRRPKQRERPFWYSAQQKQVRVYGGLSRPLD